MPRRGLAVRLTVLVFAGGGAVAGLLLTYTHHVARRLILREAERNVTHLTEAAVNHVDTVLEGAARVPEYVAALLAQQPRPEEEILTLARTILAANPAVYGAAIAFEPHGFRRDRLYFAPYFHRTDEGGVRFRWLGSDTYRYFLMDWYQLPRELGGPTWSEPYFDEGGGGVVMTTYSVPFALPADGGSRFAGVVTSDIALAWLQDYVASLDVPESGYAFLLSRTGTFVTHPRRDLVMNESIFGLAETLGAPALRALGRAMVRGERGTSRLRAPDSGEDTYVVHAPIPATGWTLAVVVPQATLLRDVVALTRTAVVLAVGGGALLLLVVAGIARAVTRPIVDLAQATGEIARGNLDAPVPAVARSDEVGLLADAFRQMQWDLKAYLEEHDQLVALRHELEVARRIQQSILPRRFPPFPEHPEVEIRGEMLPAREVGGDFYDIFLVDDARVGFAVGDVSGKGIPAAILMAVTRTLLRSAALSGRAPGDCLRQVNDLLCAENADDMFVSVFFGILDLRTGRLAYGNAGHNPPYLLRARGAAEPLPLTGEMVLGVLERLGYRTAEADLAPGDALLVYSDGITEAMTPDGELFGERRLRALLAGMGAAPPARIIQEVLDAVQGWADGAAQSDDVTLLALRWRG